MAIPPHPVRPPTPDAEIALSIAEPLLSAARRLVECKSMMQVEDALNSVYYFADILDDFIERKRCEKC